MRPGLSVFPTKVWVHGKDGWFSTPVTRDDIIRRANYIDGFKERQEERNAFKLST